jgi:hypothetical protein
MAIQKGEARSSQGSVLRVPPPWGGGGWRRGEARRGAGALIEKARFGPAPILSFPLSQPSPSQGEGTHAAGFASGTFLLRVLAWCEL